MARKIAFLAWSIKKPFCDLNLSIFLSLKINVLTIRMLFSGIMERTKKSGGLVQVKIIINDNTSFKLSCSCLAGDGNRTVNGILPLHS